MYKTPRIILRTSKTKTTKTCPPSCFLTSSQSSRSRISKRTNLEWNNHRPQSLQWRYYIPKRSLRAASFNFEHDKKGTIFVPPTTTKGYESFFDLELPEGKCVALKLLDLPSDHPDSLTTEIIEQRRRKRKNPQQSSNHNNDNDDYHWIYDELHPDEIQYGLTQLSANNKNQRCFFLGRLALRKALHSSIYKYHDDDDDVDNKDEEQNCCSLLSEHCILKDSFGRPQVPKGYLGSISHKDDIGVALVAKVLQDDKNNNNNDVVNTGIGIDLERIQSTTRRNVGPKVLTPFELHDLGQIPGISKDEEVLLRFSLKESVYKAMHPLICQYVGFQEAEVKPLPDGTATVKLQINSKVHETLGPVTAHWRRIESGFFLSSSRIQLKD